MRGEDGAKLNHREWEEKTGRGEGVGSGEGREISGWWTGYETEAYEVSIPPKYGRVYTRINGGVSCEAITFPLSCVLAAHTGEVECTRRWRRGWGVHTQWGEGSGIRYTERFAGRRWGGGIETIQHTGAHEAGRVYDSTRSKRSLPASITAGY